MAGATKSVREASMADLRTAAGMASCGGSPSITATLSILLSVAASSATVEDWEEGERVREARRQLPSQQWKPLLEQGQEWCALITYARYHLCAPQRSAPSIGIATPRPIISMRLVNPKSERGNRARKGGLNRSRRVKPYFSTAARCLQRGRARLDPLAPGRQ